MVGGPSELRFAVEVSFTICTSKAEVPFLRGAPYDVDPGK